MPMHTTWSNWFINHERNDAGNSNLQAFSDSLSSEASNVEKLQSLVEEIEEIDTVILAADASRNIIIVHSPILRRNKDPHARFRIPSGLHPG
jgi:hypothetical protein